MVAEDDPGSAKLVGIILKRLGLSVETCTDGTSVLQAFDSEYFDLILLDMNLPVVDGLELARRIRSLESGSERHVPIIALTGHAFPEDRVRCLEAGMDDFLGKPLMIDALQERICHWLGIVT